MLIEETPLQLGVGRFQTGVRRRKYKLGPTKQKTVPGISSLARVCISSSSPQSEKCPPTPRGVSSINVELRLSTIVTVSPASKDSTFGVKKSRVQL